ncbi:hypothetical protein FQR65_LT15955 [Abscondita terminalis]|nr:hypothetical protein FQR65_LT15954 [Abscondita terminalis]KAF5277578.1 hypothetical protein FQR65_LT15955 [Abscondita terminalis]
MHLSSTQEAVAGSSGVMTKPILDEAKRTYQTEEHCRNFLSGKCTLGNACPLQHKPKVMSRLSCPACNHVVCEDCVMHLQEKCPCCRRTSKVLYLAA